MINERPIAIVQEEKAQNSGSGGSLSRIATHTVLIAMAVLMIFPLIWLISTSLKSPGKQMIWPPQFIPNPVYFKNYSDLFVLAPMGTYLLNSFKISVLSVLGVCFSSSLAAFAFARMRFRGREVALRRPAGDHDAAVRRDHRPDVCHHEEPGLAEHTLPVDRAVLLRQRLLRLLAAPVLPGGSPGFVRLGDDRRRRVSSRFTGRSSSRWGCRRW